MINYQNTNRNAQKNFFPLPNSLFDLKLSVYELAIYAYMMRIEDRETYQCYASFSTIADKLGISANTVSKYVKELEQHGLIRTEHTLITTVDGRRLNGCLKYTILPIQYAIDLFYKRQMNQQDRISAQQKAIREAEKLGIEFTPDGSEQSA